MASRVLDTQLFVHQSTTRVDDFNHDFMKTQVNLGLAVEKLLLYDEGVFPTLDCAIVAVLLQWLGERELNRVLDARAMKFLKVSQWLAYAGGGKGLIQFFGHPESNPLRWGQQALWAADPADAICLQLQYRAAT
jgi:hypothetical protein